MLELDFELNTKTVSDDGYVEGIAVGYGNLDLGGDIVLPGAITTSIASRKALPMLLYHDQKRPAGVWTAFEETSDGLLTKGRFSMSTGNGKEAHGLVKDGAIGGLSMGYKTIRERMVGKARHLIEVSLHEISLVTIPMNQKALITSVKSILEAGQKPTVRAFEEFLRDAGGFSKSAAAAMASACKPHLLGDPEGAANPTDDVLAFLAALRDAPVVDLT